MRTGFLLLSILVIGWRTVVAQTQANCPWLATGSAVTALGGDVTVSAHSENNWEGECHFERSTSAGRRAIDIRVSKANFHPCPDGSAKLKALGNEAAQCRRGTADAGHADTIAGRVRDAWFEVAILGVRAADREPPKEEAPHDVYGASLLEQLAEQVAGNLF